VKAEGAGYGFSWHSWSHTAIKRKLFLSEGAAWACRLRSAQEQEGEGLWEWGGGGGEEGSCGSCACTWTPGSRPSRHLCAGSHIGAEEVTQKPEGQPEMADPWSFLGPPSANGPGPRTSKRLRSQ